MKLEKYGELKKKLLKDKKIRKSYNNLETEFSLIRVLVNKRINEGVTQKELAIRIGTKQSSISRLESGKYNPTLDFVYKVADALNAKISITIK